MEQIVSRENMTIAYGRVVGNKGSHGIDGMSCEDLPVYLNAKWSRLKEELLTDEYQPSGVRLVVIPKPDGGERKLGIPTVLDRMIQQGIHQVLSPYYETKFSERSYGFRPGRSAHQKVCRMWHQFCL